MVEQDIKQRPNYNMFRCFTTCANKETHVLKNGQGDILYVFKNKEERHLKAQAMIDILSIVYRKQEEEYLLHKRNNPQLYAPTYKEINFVAKALTKGFWSHPEDIDPNDNWFGTSRIKPDALLTKGHKQIKLSLQGISMPSPDLQSSDIMALLNNCACKYLAFIDNGKILYQDWTGNLPSNEFIEKFID
jgi:hypothetical protein